MDLVTRAQLGFPVTSPASYIASTRGVKVHYLGSPYSSRAHSGCGDQVRAIRSAHLAHPTENYSDIAYNAVVCEHGAVFEGRGPHRRTGANGTAALNAQHYAVCALLGSSGLTQPTPAMLTGLRDAIEWLRRVGDAGSEIKGHRDGHATTCPGEPLYAWVRAGAPRPLEADVPLTNDDVKRVWTTDGIVTNAGPDRETNSKLTPAQALNRLEILARRNEAKLGEQSAAIAQLVAAVATLAAGLGDLDPAAIVAELTAALESIDIRIDVPDSPAS